MPLKAPPLEGQSDLAAFDTALQSVNWTEVFLSEGSLTASELATAFASASAVETLLDDFTPLGSPIPEFFDYASEPATDMTGGISIEKYRTRKITLGLTGLTSQKASYFEQISATNRQVSILVLNSDKTAAAFFNGIRLQATIAGKQQDLWSISLAAEITRTDVFKLFTNLPTS